MGMAHHVHNHNRKSLDSAEIAELDDIMIEYNAAREQARNALIAARAAYHGIVIDASRRRDDRILGIVDGEGGRGTQARVIEHLGMNSAYLSIRLRQARRRATNDESATPGPKPLRDDASSSSTHTPADAEQAEG